MKLIHIHIYSKFYLISQNDTIQTYLTTQLNQKRNKSSGYQLHFASRVIGFEP